MKGLSLFLIKKAISFLILIVILTFFSLFLEKKREGSFLYELLGQRSQSKEMEILKKQFHDPENLWFNFKEKITLFFTFNFGKTLRGEEILPLLIEASKITLLLSMLSLIFSFFYGFLNYFLGSLKIFWQEKLLKLNFFLLSLPIFVLAIFFIWLFSLKLSIFPPGGKGPLWYFLPALTLSLKSGARLAIFLLEYKKQEEKKTYIQTLHAMGTPKNRIYAIHLLKNIFLPTVSLWLIDFSTFVAGAAILESIFALPGLGFLLISAFWQYDTHLVSAILVYSAFLVFLTNSLADVLANYFKKFSVQSHNER